MEIKAKFERQGDTWRVEVPELGNFVTTAKRLDKATEQIKDLACATSGEERCNVIIKVEAIMPGIICDLEAAQQKSREAIRLQEEASLEIGKNVQELILEHTTDYQYPIAFDFPSGHIPNNQPIIFGATSNLLINSKEVQLTYHP